MIMYIGSWITRTDKKDHLEKPAIRQGRLNQNYWPEFSKLKYYRIKFPAKIIHLTLSQIKTLHL